MRVLNNARKNTDTINYFLFKKQAMIQFGGYKYLQKKRQILIY